jgi:hypothetical protein
MIKKQTEIQSVEVICDILCDLCGETTKCADNELLSGFEYATLKFSGGFCSDFDGLRFELQICQHCAVNIFKNRKKAPGEPEIPDNHWGHL